MNALIDNFGQIVGGFRDTLSLAVVSTVLALLAGTVLAAMRVSPTPVLRLAGTSYVNIVRNTPLVVWFVIFVFGLPELGIQVSFYVRAVVALSVYTAAFVCEALRSGVNAVSAGQAEAARAIGMTFGQSLGTIVLPQAFRAVIPPLGSIVIALAKNTAVAAAFGVTEATYQLKDLHNEFASQLIPIFLGIAAGYVIIVLAVAAVAGLLERRLVVAR